MAEVFEFNSASASEALLVEKAMPCAGPNLLLRTRIHIL